MNSELATISLTHPAYVIRGNFELDPLQVEFLKRAKEYVNNAYNPIDISNLPNTACAYPTLKDLEEFSKDHKLLTAGLAVDIEAAGRHLICVGITRVADLAYICLRFRHRTGQTYWDSFDSLYKAVEWLDCILGDPQIPLGFHNGQAYDGPELEQFTYREGRWWGFQLAGFHDHPDGWDTMLMQMCAMSGFPKGLQFCATFHLGMPVWKDLVNEDDETVEGKG